MPAAPKDHPLENYQLGDLLGKGASGQVFRALNFTNGETVAVKQIQLGNIPKAELVDIMSEIHLLRDLNHPNIVKYNGFVKTKEFLYIILEYCENGSLHGILKRFGKIPENLVAVYISQVLEGLIYLHDQGVIHRDIKGANILTNKDGRVKLADFGVAAHTNVSDSAVVGSPYWMAPEIIEQAGASTASDIWSVGCVVIELLEGKPPHHALDPMQALFRIVQDDTPPIPLGASEIVKDFLLACFQKDPNLRVSAKKLMRHPWMANARRALDPLSATSSTPTDLGSLGLGADRSRHDDRAGSRDVPLKPPDGAGQLLTNHDERIQRVQEWNQKLEKTSLLPLQHKTSNHSLGKRAKFSYGPNPFPPLNPGAGLPFAMSSSFNEGLSSFGSPLASLSALGTPLVEKKEPLGLMMRKLEESQEKADIWDDDFDGSLEVEKLNVHLPPATADAKKPSSKSYPSPDEQETEDMRTIKPGRSPTLSSISLPSAPLRATSRLGNPSPEPVVEDWSDMADDETADGLQGKLAVIKKTSKQGLLHPSDLKTHQFSAASSSRSPAPHDPTLPPARSSSSPIISPYSPPPASTPHKFSSLRGSLRGGLGGSPRPSSPSAVSLSPPSTTRLRSGQVDQRALEFDADLRKYSEEAEESYDDIFDKGLLKKGSSGSLRLNTKLSGNSWLGDDVDEEDPFAEFDEAYDEPAGLAEDDAVREQHARLASNVSSLIDDLQPSAADSVLRESCDQLFNIISEFPEFQALVVSSHGMLAILEVLESKPSRQVIYRMLRIVNVIIFRDLSMLESFCLVGGIPVVLTFTSKEYSPDCRLEAAIFISALCNSSVQTLQMFISCRGLKVLVELLHEDYVQNRALVISALDGIASVFQLQSPTLRNDFCRMFTREGLQEPLSTAILSITSDQDEEAFDSKAQILSVFLLFAQASQADSRVREALSQRAILRRVLYTCSTLQSTLLVVVLKSIKHLSTNTSTLVVLHNANAIEVLTEVLGKHISGSQSTEICNHALQTLYNLCRMEKSRQNEAAQAGVIPYLKQIIEASSPLKQFALPILLELASAGRSTRNLLWANDGLHMYLELTGDPYWQGLALEAIYSWHLDETARVEDVLLEEKSTATLLACFANAKNAAFESILDPFHKLIRLSTSLIIALCSNGVLFRRLVERFARVTKALVKINLLKITRTLIEPHLDQPAVVRRSGLFDTMERLSRHDDSVLVMKLAKELVDLLKDNDRVRVPPRAPDPLRSKSVIQPSRQGFRRTTSASFIQSPAGRSSLLSSSPTGIASASPGLRPSRNMSSASSSSSSDSASSSTSKPVVPRLPPVSPGIKPVAKPLASPGHRRVPSRNGLSAIKWSPSDPSAAGRPSPSPDLATDPVPPLPVQWLGHGQRPPPPNHI